MSILVPNGVNTPEIMRTELTDRQREARARIYAMPLEALDPANASEFENETMWWKFERLRAEQPVHFTSAEQSAYGAYWSVTRWDDIIKVDTDAETFSAVAGIALSRTPQTASVLTQGDDLSPEELEAAKQRGVPSLLNMDPPEHGLHRGSVSEGVSPANIAALEPLVRERIGKILDDLPIGEEFDWVDRVSIELTAMTLATLFNYPQERRRELTYWSDVMSSAPGPGQVNETLEEKIADQKNFLAMIAQLYKARGEAEPASDFMSLMAHSPNSKNFTPAEIYGNSVVLLVGGNDTTRNTLTGSVYALDRNPAQFQKLKENPKLIPSMVAETIRWQTPLSHMTRRATRDVELGGQLIKKGDRLALWYVSGNRDEEKIEQPNEYIIDRKNPRQHLSFGFGVHRCLGNRIAELQLRLTWEEILKRFPEIKVIGNPVRAFNGFAKGYEAMTVVIPSRYEALAE
ncbi:MAG TPA: cytochrome P450 [Microbacteriaceae bacterium]|jgi:cytochrome P450|nr:cytochrome P450 [Microthrixaceae bacterium]HOA86461.1 cytochrome P450 [Microbacteriaceae bacterium]HQA23639.1 cytochrome P450 [Rhodoglobus sp.]HQC92221.1 cytochrome P450 [Microbacteriaceae bacterium]